MENRQKVRKTKMKQSANKTVYIDNWFTWYGEPQNDGVTATQLPSGRWICELNLPLINQTVKSVAKTAANAMENASNKAIPLLDKYLSEHPEISFISKSLIHHYEFYVDENGITNFRRNPEYSRKISDDLLKMQLECAKAMEKAVTRIKRANGTDKNLFVQVIDKSFFKDDDTTKDIQRKISDKLLAGTIGKLVSWQTTTIVGNCVVAVGYVMED